MFLNANDMQLGRGEPIKDTARVLGRMVHGAVIRTYAQSDVEEFSKLSKIPTIILWKIIYSNESLEAKKLILDLENSGVLHNNHVSFVEEIKKLL